MDRIRERAGGAARPACLTCMVMALFWVLGLWVGLPSWSVALVPLVGLASVGLFYVARRGRTVRW